MWATATDNPMVWSGDKCQPRNVALHEGPGKGSVCGGGSRNFRKGAPVRGKAPNPAPKARAPAGVWRPPPENLAYIFGIIMASDIIQNWAFAEQKTAAATISKPTDIR